jgi:hypothetical protein
VYDRQYDVLRGESIATGLPMAELIRRAIDHTYQPDLRRRVRGWQASIGWWHHPDAAAAGRRAGSKS